MPIVGRMPEIIAIVLLAVMSVVGLLNWLNRRHGGFARGWAGAIFIGICWMGAIAVILLKVR